MVDDFLGKIVWLKKFRQCQGDITGGGSVCQNKFVWNWGLLMRTAGGSLFGGRSRLVGLLIGRD